ncbi:MAG TPA: hypothetical protein VLC09_10640 [Polyangiaceae bacterium]|nr:hypothetical protein [Polyangiaceae bacterium]
MKGVYGRVGLLVLGAFLLVQVGIGVWAARRVHSESDYFVAGKRLGPWLLTMSLFATWFGAETCLGVSGTVYREGLRGGRAEPLGYALCLALSGLLLAGRMSRGNFVTLGDLFRARGGPWVERAVVLLLVPSSLLWGAAQVRALGLVVSQIAEVPLALSIIASGLVVVAYSFLGGMWGDVATDLLQGIILSLGLFALLAVVLLNAPDGGWTQALSQERLTLLPADEGMWSQLDRMAIPVLGSLVTQELVARLLGARSEAVARRSAWWAAGLYLLVGAIPVFLGLLGPALLPGLTEHESYLPRLAAHYLPGAFGSLFSCALLAAILSTVDSVLLSNSALLSHNLLAPLFGVSGDRARLWLGRAVLVLAGCFALVVALFAEGIYDLVELASSIGTAGVLVVTLAALYAPRLDRNAALAALLVGLVSTPALRWLGFGAPFLASVAAAALIWWGWQYGAPGWLRLRGGSRTASFPSSGGTPD